MAAEVRDREEAGGADAEVRVGKPRFEGNASRRASLSVASRTYSCAPRDLCAFARPFCACLSSSAGGRAPAQGYNLALAAA